MVRILLFLALVTFPALSYAEDVLESQVVENVGEHKTSQAETLPSILKEINAPELKTSEEREPEEVISYSLQHEKVALPECDNEQLVQKAREQAETFLKNYQSNSTLFRRRRHFILKGLDRFTKENTANYKTAAATPVSDIIADLKINGGVAEENMLLCKNENSANLKHPIYLLVYPIEGGFKVRIINLVEKQSPNDELSFTLEK